MDEKTIELDLRGESCPFNFVKTKLQLDELESGDRLAVIFDYAPAISNVSKSVKNEGHTILSIESEGNSIWKVHIRKN